MVPFPPPRAQLELYNIHWDEMFFSEGVPFVGIELQRYCFGTLFSECSFSRNPLRTSQHGAPLWLG